MFARQTKDDFWNYYLRDDGHIGFRSAEKTVRRKDSLSNKSGSSFRQSSSERSRLMKTRSIFTLILAVANGTFAQPALHLFGTVRDSSGAPTAGVRVELYPGFYRGAGHYTEVRTDANGRYEIIQLPESSGFFWGHPNPTNSIMARDFERNLAAFQEFDQTTTNMDLVLQPAITLTGSVKNTLGAPVNDAEVELLFLSGDSLALLEPRPKVDALGSFSIPALPQGRDYTIWGIKAKGYGTAFGRVDARNTQTNSYEFPNLVLKRADHQLAGRVVDNHGKPLVGTRVSFNGAGQPQNDGTNTDSDGKFLFDAVCDGSLKVFASYQDPQDTSIHMDLNGGGGMAVRPGDTNILIQLRDTSISAWDVPTLVTMGTVYDPAGNPAPNTVFAVWHSANPFNSSSSGFGGKYRIRWQQPLGMGMQTAAKSLLIGRDASRNLVVTHEIDETTTNLDLHLQPGLAIAGILQDENGMAVTNARVSLHMQLARGGSELAKMVTDEHGAFAFSALPAEGKYSLDVGSSYSYTRGSWGVMEVTGGETNLVLRLTSPLTNYDSAQLPLHRER